MKAPVGLLSDRTVLRQQDGGVYPDKFRTGKAVRFDAEDGFGVRGFPEQLLQQQADAGLPLAALAGHDQHLLRLGRRDQKIAEIFLQGQNVLWDEQTVQKFQVKQKRKQNLTNWKDWL